MSGGLLLQVYRTLASQLILLGKKCRTQYVCRTIANQLALKRASIF